MNLGWIFVCAVVVSIKAKTVHKEIQLVICSDTYREFTLELDEEEIFHSDFNQGKMVITLPEFADPRSPEQGFYENSVAILDNCKQNLDVTIKSTKSPAEPTNPPHSTLYSRNDVQLDSRNTLICHISGFYPPQAGVSWTKNGVNVTKDASLSQYHLNDDGTVNLISTLSFTPQQGDIYTCTVQHKGLPIPDTKTWEVDVKVPSVGPSVFCGVGLAAGLLGVATGTFFLIKGNQCN